MASLLANGGSEAVISLELTEAYIGSFAYIHISGAVSSRVERELRKAALAGALAT